MTEDLCRFSLIYPTWLPWLVLGIGVVIFVISVWYAPLGTIRVPVVEIQLSILVAVALVMLAVSISGFVALNHQPFARWVGEKLPWSISEADATVSAQLNDKPLGELEASPTALYIVKIDPAARGVKINGTYRDALCDADLFSRICRNESQRLTCDTDPSAKVIRICSKTNDGPCRKRTL